MSNHRKLRLRRLLSHGGTDQVCPQVTINDLPDEGLLEIFGFYMAYPYPLPPLSYKEHAWHTLVHVCRRWRYVIFGSPLRLNLRILCMNLNGTLTKTLDIWPDLPIIVHVNDRALDIWPDLPFIVYGNDKETFPLRSVTSVISRLKRNNRVCKIIIDNVPGSLLGGLATMTESFPALIELKLVPSMVDPPKLPDLFLGGSVPSLRSLKLWDISFPALGKLLLTTRDLVILSLDIIRSTEYIPPKAMVDILSALTRLESLHLGYQIWVFGADQRISPPVLPRVVLPSLTTFDFAGNSKILGYIASRIDAPLESIAVTANLSKQDQLEFDILLLRDFIWHTKLLNAPHRADTFFIDYNSRISLFERKGGIDFRVLDLVIPCFDPDTQLSALLQICNSLLLPLPSIEHLGIYKFESELLSLRWENGEVGAPWVVLLRPFIAVKDLVLDEPVVLSVASVLHCIWGERATAILPSLQNIFLEGFQLSSPVPKGITTFIAQRELYDRPVVVHHQERK